ncbi:MAG: peptide-methionine (S)-S-oxide reductase MsrA [Nanoarchaeota archaeon]
MPNKSYKLATFAGGCFWCMVQSFNIPGVYEVIAGYTGGKVKNPSYEEVSTGKTGHYEAIQIKYNPKEITYKELLEIFWRQIDPIDDRGQFSDKGPQYKTAIFYHDQSQKILAEESKQKLEKSERFNKIATEIKKASEFYPAEEYHQNYYKKNPINYKMYRYASGRDDFREKV